MRRWNLSQFQSQVNTFKWLFPVKTNNVLFYSPSNVLPDSVINFYPGTISESHVFLSSVEKYIDRQLSVCYEWF